MIGLVAAGVFTWQQEAQYTSVTQLFVSSNAVATDNNDLNQGGNFAQQRVRSYVDLVDSPVIAAKVMKDLGLRYDADEFSLMVEATTPPDTVLIDISVTDASPSGARDIAAAVAARFTELVTQIERIPGRKGSSVKVTVIKPATWSDSPVSPNVGLNLALGFLAGLSVGGGVAVVRQSMDKRLRRPEELANVTSSPVLSTIPVKKGAKESPLIIEGSAQSAHAESMRQLRTNLQYVDVDRPVRSLVVTSAMPNEGKTMTACNLGIAFAEAGTRVLLVDADLRRPKVADYLGLEGAVGLTNVLAGQALIADAIQQWGDTGLWVLPSGYVPPNPSELLGSQNMVDLVSALTTGFDIVIVDTPPLLPVTDGAVMAAVADGCLVVSRHGKTTSTQAAAAVKALQKVGARLYGTVLNMIPRRPEGNYSYGYSSATASAGQPDQVTATMPSGRALKPATAQSGHPRGSTSTGYSANQPRTGRHSPLSDAPTTEIRMPGTYRATHPANVENEQYVRSASQRR